MSFRRLAIGTSVVCRCFVKGLRTTVVGPSLSSETAENLSALKPISEPLKTDDKPQTSIAEYEHDWFPAQLTDNTVETYSDIIPEDAEKKKPAVYKSKKFLKSYTLAPFVNDSDTLKRLVDLGVNLSVLDSKYNAADFLVKLDFDKDVAPIISFLVNNGMPLTFLGAYFTKNPWIFQQDLDDLQVRINYLQSKKFSGAAIARIICMARYWLNLEVKAVDSRLGWIQKEFSLTGDEVRFVVTKVPKVVTFGTGCMQLLRFVFEEQLGFNAEEMKQLLLADPKLWITNKEALEKNFDYLQHTMGFSHRKILEYPKAMRFRISHIRNRHEFLKQQNRDQYDSTAPNYVSLKDLLTRSDLAFCTHIAKCPVSVYNKFLKTQ